MACENRDRPRRRRGRRGSHARAAAAHARAAAAAAVTPGGLPAVAWSKTAESVGGTSNDTVGSTAKGIRSHDHPRRSGAGEPHMGLPAGAQPAAPSGGRTAGSASRRARPARGRPRLAELRRSQRNTTRADKPPAAGEDERGRAVLLSVSLAASATRGR